MSLRHATLSLLKRHGSRGDVVLVNNGSTDLPLDLSVNSYIDDRIELLAYVKEALSKTDGKARSKITLLVAIDDQFNGQINSLCKIIYKEISYSIESYDYINWQGENLAMEIRANA